ncbi:hypothetical protein [Flavobacterium sp.]|uniref:hypothetical protein n=1 Tax=Flavobacterium sp. TaxID=239 RepID=UPI003D0E2687
MAKEPFAAQLTSLWIGAFFFWMIKGFRGKLSDQFILQFEKRNIWIGYCIQLFFIVIIINYIIEGTP